MDGDAAATGTGTLELVRGDYDGYAILASASVAVPRDTCAAESERERERASSRAAAAASGISR